MDTCPVGNHKKIENALERQTHMCSSCATERIPIGPHVMTEGIDHGAVAEGPYR